MKIKKWNVPVLFSLGVVCAFGYADDEKKIEELLKQKKDIELQIKELTKQQQDDKQKKDQERSQEILVTANRRVTSTEEIGRSYSIIDQETLINTGANDVLDALRTIESIHILQTGRKGGTTSVYTRGGETNHTKFLVNGFEINSDGGGIDLDNLIVDDIERIEVVRGPGSSLYGSNAAAGVINIITKKGEGPATFKMSAATGSYGAHKENLTLSGGDKKIDYMVSLSYYDKPDGRYENTPYTNTTMSTNVGVRPSDSLELRLTSRFVEDEVGSGFSSAGPKFEPQDPNDISNEDHSLIGAEAIMQFSPKWESTIKLSRFDEDVEFISEQDPAPSSWPSFHFDSADSIFSTSFQRNNVLWSNRFEFNDYYTLTAGYDFNDENGRNSTNTERFDRDINAYFLQNHIKATDDLFINLDGRWDTSTEFKDQFSSHASTKYHMRKLGTTLRANGGTSFKAPSFAEVQGGTFITGLVNSPDDPKVEKTVGWDVGLDQSLNEYGSLSVTYFENTFRDLIETINSEYRHAGKARARGWEFSYFVKLHKRLSLKANWTLMNTRVSKTLINPSTSAGQQFAVGEDLIRRPHSFGHVSLTYQPTDYLTTNVSTHYVGEYDDRDFQGVDFVTNSVPKRVNVSDHWLTNVTFNYDVAQVDGLKLFGTFGNVFDEDYDEPFGFPAEKSNFFGGASYLLTF